LVVVFSSATNAMSLWARVFWQHLPWTWLPGVALSVLERDLFLQQECFPSWAAGETSRTSERVFRPGVAEQHEPEQQQSLLSVENPQQNDLRVPFGQKQLKCGAPPNSVVTAVNQTNPT
jgi:hypothetical protein